MDSNYCNLPGYFTLHNVTQGKTVQLDKAGTQSMAANKGDKIEIFSTASDFFSKAKKVYTVGGINSLSENGGTIRLNGGVVFSTH